MTEIVVVLTTVPASFDAAELARELLEGRVAACVTILPSVRTIFSWDGKLQEEAEQQLILKTTRDRVDALWRLLKSRHPYDVPEFMVLPVVDGYPSYLDWVASIRAPGPDRP
jgi:periplasmic divalent cation tolerance protein